jgi:hypothetical protein
MLELSNFERVPKFDFSTGQPRRQTSENKFGLPVHSEAQGSLNYFVSNLLCMKAGFVDDL